jgi:hypothetical protein
MRKKTSAIRLRNANAAAGSLLVTAKLCGGGGESLAPLLERPLQKKAAGFTSNPAAQFWEFSFA